MGQNHSLPIPRYGWCISAQHSDLENHAHSRDHRRELKKSHHRRNLSAAFSFSPESVVGDAVGARDTDNSLPSPTSWSITGDGEEFRSSIWSSDTASELVNINTATEEELMTLRGVNRSMARAIVEHRVAISGYRRIEDLALVSGVGAARLQLICDEICVYPRGRGDYRCSKLSRRSSATSSGIDISGTTTSMDSRVTDGVPAAAQIGSKSNVETARTPCSEKYYVGQSYTKSEAKTAVIFPVNFQSIHVDAINASSASEVAQLLDSSSDFRNNDFVKFCPGITDKISPEILDNASCNACIAIYGTSNGGSCVPRTSPSLAKGLLERVHSTHGCLLTEKLDENHRISYGDPEKKFGIPNGSINRNRSSRPLLRLGVWSLDGCSKSKVDNLGVREVIASTILNNRLSMVALHDLADDQYVLQKLCDELNNVAVPAQVADKQKTCERHGRQWRCFSSSSQSQSNSKCGFLYDSEVISNVTKCGGVSLMYSQTLSHLSVCAATFTIRRSAEIITFCSFARSGVDYQELAYNDDVQQLLRAIQEDVTGNILLAGTCPANLEKQWLPLTMTSTMEEHSSAMSVPTVGRNMWLNEAAYTSYSGHMKIIFNDLTNPRIPKGTWGWGGSVSSSCPVYAELSVSHLYESNT